jgi:hypothetical protein
MHRPGLQLIVIAELLKGSRERSRRADAIEVGELLAGAGLENGLVYNEVSCLLALLEGAL